MSEERRSGHKAEVASSYNQKQIDRRIYTGMAITSTDVAHERLQTPTQAPHKLLCVWAGSPLPISRSHYRASMFGEVPGLV